MFFLRTETKESSLNQKIEKKIRKVARKKAIEINTRSFLEIHTLPLKQRLMCAWRLIFKDPRWGDA